MSNVGDVKQGVASQAGVAQTQEGSAEAAATTPAQPQVSPERLALARREKAIRERERSFQAREAKWKEQETKYQSDYIPKSRLKEDPLSLFQDGLLTYDELTQAILNSGAKADPAVMAQSRQIKELEAKIAQLSSGIEESQSQTTTQVKNQIAFEVKSFLAGNKDGYEVLMAYGEDQAEAAVVALIDETWKTDGKLLDAQEAAQHIEDHLIEEATKFAGLKKVQAKLHPTDSMEAEKGEAAALQAAQDGQFSNRFKQTQSSSQGTTMAPRTLKTLIHGASSPTAGRVMTEREAVARALAKAKGQ